MCIPSLINMMHDASMMNAFSLIDLSDQSIHPIIPPILVKATKQRLKPITPIPILPYPNSVTHSELNPVLFSGPSPFPPPFMSPGTQFQLHFSNRTIRMKDVNRLIGVGRRGPRSVQTSGVGVGVRF
jgi:hypothetical protein